MNYLSLDQYKYAWVFKRQDMAISPEDLACIKPLTSKRAAEIWRSQISPVCLYPSHFGPGDWASNDKVWQGKDQWQGVWNSTDPDIPALLSEHINWEPNVVVYFCYKHDHVIETSWGVFQRCWKSFLFFDDGPLLIGRKRKQVAQFFDNGVMTVGTRP